jgi:hypothetical protein
MGERQAIDLVIGMFRCRHGGDWLRGIFGWRSGFVLLSLKVIEPFAEVGERSADYGKHEMRQGAG